jgi:hypothetical protein
MTQNIGCKVFFFMYRNFHDNFYKHVQVAKHSLILGKWMPSEIVESSGERPTVNDAVGGFSVFLASRISHSICASQVSSYVLRPVVLPIFYKMSTFFSFFRGRIVDLSLVTSTNSWSCEFQRIFSARRND